MSGDYRRLKQVSHNFLRRMLRKPAWSFKRFVVDRRGLQGRRWSLAILMESLLDGYLSNRGSLRAVERLTEMSGRARISDTTLYDFVSRFGKEEVAELRQQLDAQVVHPAEQRPYAQLRMVRTVLISAASKPAIDQVVIRAETNECGMFAEVFEQLEADYGALVEVYSGDAAFCSEANARLVAKAGKGYIFGLKGNRRELWREATRVLGAETVAIITTPWEKYQGARVRYRLYRTTEMEGYLDWEHLKQVWRIEKERVKPQSGTVERENRYYVTNLHLGRFKPEQIVQVVRAHWGIENNCNWTMDVIWDEDTKVWCGRGAAIQALGLIRLMAYNLVALWRCRYLRRREEQRQEKRSWQEFFELILQLFSGAESDFSNLRVTAGL